jgi:hypothetical protein
MKPENKRIAVLGGVAAVIAIAGGIYLVLNREDDSIPEVTKGIYYTGPMKSKGGSGNYGTIDGQTMDPEQGKAAAAEWLKQHPELDKGGPGAAAPANAGPSNKQGEVN